VQYLHVEGNRHVDFNFLSPETTSISFVTKNEKMPFVRSY